MSNSEIDIFKLCEDGDLYQLKKLFKTKKGSASIRESLSSLPLFAILKGQFEVVKYLFNGIKNNDTLFSEMNLKVFIEAACNHDEVQILDFLLKHPKIIADNFLGNASVAPDSGKYGCVKVLDYLFNEFPNHKELHSHLTSGFIMTYAADNGQLDVIKYFLNSEYLKQYVDIHVKDDLIIRLAYQKSHLDLVNYLVFDLKMEPTPYLEEYMKSHPELKKIFEKRDLNTQLKEELISNENNTKRMKI